MKKFILPFLLVLLLGSGCTTTLETDKKRTVHLYFGFGALIQSDKELKATGIPKAKKLKETKRCKGQCRGNCIRPCSLNCKKSCSKKPKAKPSKRVS